MTTRHRRRLLVPIIGLLAATVLGSAPLHASSGSTDRTVKLKTTTAFRTEGENQIMTTTAVQINTRTEASPDGVKKKTTTTSKDKKVQNFPKLNRVVTTLTEVTKTIDVDTTTIVKRTTTITEVTTKDEAAGAKLVKGCEGTGWTSPDDLSFTRKVARCKPGFPAPKPLATKEKVKVSSSFKLEFNSPLLLAISEGEFAKENLEIEWISLPFATAAAQLGTGQIDVGVGGFEVALYNAAAQGLGVKVALANYFPPKAGDYKTPQTGLWCRRSFFSNPANPDFKELQNGSRWGTSVGKGSSAVYYSVTELRKKVPNFNPKNITFSIVPSSSAWDALRNKAQDCMVMLDPLWQLPAADPANYVQASTQTPAEPLGIYAYGKRLLEDRRDIGVAFARAFIRTVNTYFQSDYHNDPVTPALIKKNVPAYDIEANKKYDSLVMDWEIRSGTTFKMQKLFKDIGALTIPIVPEDKLVDREFYEIAVGKKKG